MAPKPSSSKSRDINLLTVEYNPSTDAVKHAPGAPTNPKSLKLNRNNPLASLKGTQSADSLIGKIQTFLRDSPIGRTFSLNPHKMYHDYLCESTLR